MIWNGLAGDNVGVVDWIKCFLCRSIAVYRFLFYYRNFVIKWLYRRFTNTKNRKKLYFRCETSTMVWSQINETTWKSGKELFALKLTHLISWSKVNYGCRIISAQMWRRVFIFSAQPLLLYIIRHQFQCQCQTELNIEILCETNNTKHE